MLYFYLLIDLCVYVNVNVHLSIAALEDSGFRLPGAGDTGNCEPLYVGAGNWTQVLCKSSKFSNFQRKAHSVGSPVCMGWGGGVCVVDMETESLQRKTSWAVERKG